jgi:serine/threonine-protein kinase
VRASPAWLSFYHELAATKVLQHPNILPILDYGSLDQGPFLVLPLCTAGNLRAVLEQRDFLHPTLFMPMLGQIAYAVDFAHSKGIIHGDVKPENMLFPRDLSQICLSDFGAAKFFSVSEDITDPDPTGGLGTVSYLSPEQIESNIQTPLSDVYSLGVVAYEALTGTFPYDLNKTTFQQMKDKTEGRVLDPVYANHHIWPSARHTLLACLSVDPKKRPQSAMALYHLLAGHATPLEQRKRRSLWRFLSKEQ